MRGERGENRKGGSERRGQRGENRRGSSERREGR